MKHNKIRDLDAQRRAALEKLRKPVSDPTLAVGDLVFYKGAYATVTRIYTYAPWTHDDSPIRNDFTAVEVITDNGTRWTGKAPEAEEATTQQAPYVPAEGDRVRITRVTPRGVIKFVKSGVVGSVITDNYFEFTEDMDSTHPAMHVYVTSDKGVQAHMPGWLQTTERIGAA